MVGLFIVSMVAILLASAVTRQNSAQRRLADSRAATRLAEHALLNLQLAQPLPQPAAAEQIEIHPTAGGQAPAGYTWAVAHAAVRGQQATVFGVVPAGAPR